MAIVEIKKLKKDYKGFLALNGIDLSLEKGKIVGLLGPNGSGKTTLIKPVSYTHLTLPTTPYV